MITLESRLNIKYTIALYRINFFSNILFNNEQSIKVDIALFKLKNNEYEYINLLERLLEKLLNTVNLYESGLNSLCYDELKYKAVKNLIAYIQKDIEHDFTYKEDIDVILYTVENEYINNYIEPRKKDFYNLYLKNISSVIYNFLYELKNIKQYNANSYDTLIYYISILKTFNKLLKSTSGEKQNVV